MIRKAELIDYDRILEIYQSARSYMKANDNPDQWGETYPPCELVKADILNGKLYVCDEGKVYAVFFFDKGPDPTYAKIYEGSWLSDEEYYVVHRVASSGEKSGMLAEIIKYAYNESGHLRIDTHDDNLIMQKALEKNGFKRCGYIFIEDGSRRIAYELV